MLTIDRAIVTPLHVQVLNLVAQWAVPRAELDLRLEGGTALAGYHLHHRESEDLDFFVAPDTRMPALAVLAEAALAGAHLSATSTRPPAFGFLEYVVFDPMARASSEGSAGIKVQFAASSSFRLEPLDATAELIPVASYRDLCAGKLQAIVGRFEPRDFIDFHAIMMRPDQAGTLPTEPTMREHMRALVRDVMQCDPGFDLPYIGRGLSRGVNRPLVSAFPLRIFTPMAEADVQHMLRLCVDEIAVMTVS